MSIENALESLIGELEQDRSLNELWHLRQRVEALDQLDVYLLVGQASGTALRHRERAIYTKFESVNSRLYEGIRRNIQRGLCQEDEKSSCCTKDEGGPFEAAL